MQAASCLLVLALGALSAAAEAPSTPGAAAVEEFLTRCAAAGAIVPIPNPETGKPDRDPKTGIPRFAVPDLATLRSAGYTTGKE